MNAEKIKLALIAEIKYYISAPEQYAHFFKLKERLDIICSFLKTAGLTDERLNQLIEIAKND